MSNIIVFYDAQNFSNIKNFEPVEDSISKHGKISVMRIYHDFIGKDNPWKKLCFDRGMKPCQITSPKKNTADLLITIDALKIAYSNSSDIFCFATNDSDFYPISLELKQMGRTTMLVTSRNSRQQGIAQEEDYCFSIVERVDFDKIAQIKASEIQQSKPKTKNLEVKEVKQEPKEDPRVLEQRAEELAVLAGKIKQYISSRYGTLKKDNDGWASYGTLCSGLLKKYPDSDVDYKAMGYKDRKDFIVKSGYEIKANDFRVKK